MYINGKPHGPWQANTTCQLHMRAFKDNDTIVIEPWRANAFPVIKDLTVDRSAFDRIIQAGGYVSVNTGNAVDGNSLPIEKAKADEAFAAAMCIGCGACVAGPERKTRVTNMVAQLDKEGFGACTNTGACEAACPKEISIANIARLNKEYIVAGLTSE
jgi:succinate dehydrogenase / fumarate reductase iron-sulfur subunit